MVLHCIYCAFHKHANSKQTLKHRNTQNGLKSTNHKPWPFEPVKAKFCFLRGPLRWLTAAKSAIVNWLLNFRIRLFVKSTVHRDFLGYPLNNLKILGSVRISLLGTFLNKVKPNLFSLRTSPWDLVFGAGIFGVLFVAFIWLSSSLKNPEFFPWSLFFLELVLEHYYCHAGHLHVLDRRCMIKT